MSQLPVANDTLQAPVPSANWGRPLLASFVILVTTFVGFGGWAAIAPLDSAVVASGTIESEGNRKTVQHLEGGILAELLVRDGSVVHEGDVLLRLDATRSQASDRLLRKQQAIAMALEARLIAQRDGHDAIKFPRDVTELSNDNDVAAAIADSQRQFETKRQVYSSIRNALESQIEQAEKDQDQAKSDTLTAERLLTSALDELEPLKPLFEKQLVPVPRMTALQRQIDQFKGARDKATIDLARTTEKRRELTLKRKQVSDEYAQEASAALPDVRKQLADVGQQLLIAADMLKRVDITAPVSGTVQQLRIFTIGGVIKPGDAILDIAPLSGELVVRSKVSPIDVDRLHVGGRAEIRMQQFAKFQSQAVFGKIRSISRDSITDPGPSQAAYYLAEISVDKQNFPEALRNRLVAGMAVQTIIPTEIRTALQYILEPILDRVATGMRER